MVPFLLFAILPSRSRVPFQSLLNLQHGHRLHRNINRESRECLAESGHSDGRIAASSPHVVVD